MDKEQEKIDIFCKRCGARMIFKGIQNGKQAYLCTNPDCEHQPTNLEFREDIWDIYFIRIIYRNCFDRPKPLLTMNQLATLFGKHYDTTKKWATASQEWVDSHTPQKKPSAKELKAYIKIAKPDTYEDILNLCLVNGKAAANETLAKLRKIKREKKQQGRPKNPKLMPIHKNKTELRYDDEIEDMGWISKEDREHAKQEKLIETAEKYNAKVAAVNEFCERAFALDYPIEHRKDAILWFGVIIGCTFGELIGAKYSDRVENDRFIHLTRYVEFPPKLKRPFSKRKAVIGFDMYDTLKQEHEIKIIEDAFDRFYLVDDRAIRMLDYLQENTRRHKQINPNYDYSNDDFICLDENGKRYYTNELNARLAILCRKLGTLNLSFNDLIYYH